MYNELEWRNFDNEWQTAVVKDTRAVQINPLEPKIRKLYRTLNLKEPAHFIFTRNPLEMFSLQAYLDGKSDRYDNLADTYRRHKRQIDAIKKGSKPMTAELMEYALAYAFLKDKVIKNPIGHYDGPEKVLTELIDFENEQVSGIKLNSLEDDIFNPVKRFEDIVEKILTKGQYDASGHKIKVPGWAILNSADDFTNMSFAAGNWAVYTPKFRFLQECFKVNHPLVDMVCEISENLHYWMAYEDHVILCDRPSVNKMNGPQGRLHDETGPAIGYDDFRLYYHGDRIIPPSFIEEPIDPNKIDKEPNAEMRRVLFELFGPENWVKAKGAELINEDNIGGLPYELYRTQDEMGNRLHILRCVDGTPKWNGKTYEPQVYWLQVDREANTCKEAVARSYNVTPEQYQAALVRT